MHEEKNRQLPDSHELEPMDREQFSFAFNIAVQAGHYKMPIKNPEQYGFYLEDEEAGGVSKITLKDSPINRAGIAAIDHFEGDGEMFHNFMMRFWALIDLLNKKSAKKWINEDPDDTEATLIHPALIYAASEFELTKNGAFKVRDFLERVKEIAETEFVDLE